MPLSDETRQHARELGRSLREGTLCVIAGAGISVPAGLPSWSQLVRDVSESLGIELNEKTLADPLLAMSLVEAGLGGNPRRRLVRAIKRQFPSSARPTLVHRLLVGLGCAIFTTNIDDLFEKAAAADGCRRRVWRQDTDVPGSSGEPICKLHGDLAEPRTLVLSQSDYFDILSKIQSPVLFEQLWAQLQRSDVLMVGHSYSDPDLQWAHHHIRAVLGKAARKIRILQADVTPDRRTELKGVYGLTIVELESYEEIPEFLKRVAASSRAERVMPIETPHSGQLTADEGGGIDEAWEAEAKEIDALLGACDFEGAYRRATRWERVLTERSEVSGRAVAKLHRIKAICHREAGRHDEARREIALACKADPPNAKNKVQLSVIEYVTHGPAAAARVLKGVRGLEGKRARAWLRLEAGYRGPVHRLVRDPKAGQDAECQLLFAHGFLRRGEYAEAEQAAERARELSGRPRCLELCGDILLSLGMRRVQELVHERAILQPVHEVPLEGLIEESPVRQALDCYLRALDGIADSNEQAVAALAEKLLRCAHALSDGARAREYSALTRVGRCVARISGTSARQRKHEARAVCQEILAEDGGSGTAGQLLINVAAELRVRGLDEAVLVLLGGHPRSVPDDLRLYWHLQKAFALLRIRGRRAAMRELAKARTCPQGTGAVLLAKARLFAAVGDGKRALRSFEKAEKTGEFRASVLWHFGVFALRELRHYDKAAELLGQLVQLVASSRIGEAFVEAASLADDELWLRRAIAEGGRMLSDGHESRALLLPLIRAHFRERNWPQARELAARYLELWPDDAMVRNDYALFLAHTGDIDSALLELDRARQGHGAAHEERQFAYLVNKSRILMEGERYEEMYRAAKEARTRFPERQLLWAAVMQACQLTGREGEMAEAAARFHHRFPEDPSVVACQGARSLVRVLREDNDARREALRDYLRGAIPLRGFAARWGVPQSAAWHWLSQSEKLVSGSFTPAAVLNQSRHIRDGVTLVMDYSTVVTVDALGLWPHLDMLPGVCVTSALKRQLAQDAPRLQARLRPNARAAREEIEGVLGRPTVQICEEFSLDSAPRSWLKEHDLFTVADRCEAQRLGCRILNDTDVQLPESMRLRTSQLVTLMQRKGWLSGTRCTEVLEDLRNRRGFQTDMSDAPLSARHGVITTPIVLSREAMETLQSVGLLTDVAARFSRLVVTAPAYNDVAGDLSALRFFSSVKASHDRIRCELERVQDIEVPSSALIDAGFRGTEELEEVEQLWYSVRGPDRLLWCDDLFTRSITPKHPAVGDAKCLGTPSVLLWLKEKGALSDEDYHRLVCRLVERRFEYIVLQKQDLLWALREHNWQRSDMAEAVLRYASRMFDHYPPAPDVVMFFVDYLHCVLENLWQQNHLLFDAKLSMASWATYALLPERIEQLGIRDMPKKLVTVMFFRLERLPRHAARAFAFWIREFAQDHGLSASDVGSCVADSLRALLELDALPEPHRRELARQFLYALPACIRYLLPRRKLEDTNASLGLSLPLSPQGTLEVLGDFGRYEFALEDVRTIAEQLVAKEGCSAVDGDGMVQAPVSPALVAMARREAGVPHWEEVTPEIRVIVPVPAKTLLLSEQPGVRQTAAEWGADRIAASRSMLAERATGFLRRKDWSRREVVELAFLHDSPALRLVEGGGAPDDPDWQAALINVSWRVLVSCYGDPPRPVDALPSIRPKDWSDALHRVFPERAAVVLAGRELSARKRKLVTRELIKVLSSTFDPFAMGLALEALCEITDEGELLGPRQLRVVRDSVLSALRCFGSGTARGARYHAFVEILRAVSWVARKALHEGGRARPRSRQLAAVPLGAARDICLVSKLGELKKNEASSIAASFFILSGGLASAATREGYARRLSDAGDLRSALRSALLPSVVTDVLARHAAFSRRLMDDNLVRQLLACLQPPFCSCAPLGRSRNVARVMPGLPHPQSAHEVLSNLLDGTEREEFHMQWRAPRWPAVPAQLERLPAAFQDGLSLELSSVVTLIPVRVVRSLYRATGGGESVWQRVADGSVGPAFLAWRALPSLARSQRDDLVRATSHAMLSACKGGDVQVVQASIRIVTPHVPDVTADEWETLSAPFFALLQENALSPMERRLIALLLLSLPENVGRLASELAADFVRKRFPEMVAELASEYEQL